MRRTWLYLAIACLGTALFHGGDAAAQAPDRGAITGVVIDAETGLPLPGAAVHIRELGRGQATLPDGSFRFERLPPRALSVVAQHLGYHPAEARLQVRAGETAELRLVLEPSPIELSAIVVTGLGRERGVADTYRPTAVLAGRELERNLQPSLGATLQRLPGLHSVFNGPAATRPIIRGMGEDRVLILEDGQRTGDLSTTAPDHAVSIDPISAERIEVVRGPAGLLYGSNALGGVINVWREEVPRSMPERVSGTVTATGESVNRGAGAHVLVRAPAGPFSLRLEGSGRAAGNTYTPLGVLPSTDLQTFSIAAGASLVPEWGFVGLAYRYYDSRYGVPGEFNGVLIPGAHPGGVDIAMRRHVLRAQAAHLLGFGPIETVEVNTHLTHYQHEEIEGFGPDGRPWIGARFDKLKGSVNVIARHTHDLEAFSTEGAFGLTATALDLITGGGFTGKRSAQETTLAGFLFEEFARAPLRLQVGARYDLIFVSPHDHRPIDTGQRLVPVTDRTFGNASASAALLWDLQPGWTLGVNAARAFRSPSIKELFSDGPHLADFGYDIGNPELSSEIGHGFDLFLRVIGRRTNLELSTFVNRISNFIYYRPTGEIDPRFGRFPVFQATSDDAMFLGFEGRLQVEVLSGLVLDGTSSYVRATRLGDGSPLPAIPPLRLNVELRYERGGFFGAAGLAAAASQRRVSPPIAAAHDGGDVILPERPTAGYALLNAAAGYRFEMGGIVHSITLQAHNLTDAVWRDHVSVIKDVAPQPGRNVQLSYRILF